MLNVYAHSLNVCKGSTLFFFNILVRVCIPCGFSGSDCCGSKWGKCFCWRPKVKRCCRHVPEPTCIAKNSACRGLKRPFEVALSAATRAVDHTRHLVNVANAALKAAEVVIRNAHHVLTVAQAALNGVKAACRAGIAALQYANKAIFTTINIQEISFHTSLSVANRGSFAVNVKARIANSPTSFGTNFNMHNPIELIKALANKLVSGLTNFIRV